MRQLPEICWYLAKRTYFIYVNQGGTAIELSSLTAMNNAVRDFFYGSGQEEQYDLSIT